MWADAINLNRIGCVCACVCVYIDLLVGIRQPRALMSGERESRREMLNVYACVCLCVALKRSFRVGRSAARRRRRQAPNDKKEKRMLVKKKKEDFYSHIKRGEGK